MYFLLDFSLRDVFTLCAKLWIKLEKNSALSVLFRVHWPSSGFANLASGTDCDFSSHTLWESTICIIVVVCQSGHTEAQNLPWGWKQWPASGRGSVFHPFTALTFSVSPYDTKKKRIKEKSKSWY